MLSCVFISVFSLLAAFSDHAPIFSQMKTMSASQPNTPLRSSPKPHFTRIISLSPTVHYNMEQNAVSETY